MNENTTSLRGEQRRRARMRKADRLALLEETLANVWMWHATDGQDLDALRKILSSADHDAQIIAALDRLPVRS